MFSRAFRYNTLIGLLLVLAFMACLWLASWFGGLFFDFISHRASVEYLKSDFIRIGFQFFFVLVGMILWVSLTVRRR
jgi:uncharacterized membrane protein